MDTKGDLERFRRMALELGRRLKRHHTVLELAIVGSVAGDDPYPSDLDLAMALSDTSELTSIARCARQVGEHPAWEVFVFDESLTHLGRLCHFNECPKGKEDCRMMGCGRPVFVQKVQGFTFD